MEQKPGKVQDPMPHVDRRIQKTKKVLSESLIGLILEKGYERVTIQDIIDKANVGRSTFYSHYEGKDQLLLEGHKNLGISLFEEMDAEHKRPGKHSLGFLPLFQHAGKNLPLAKAMLGKKSGALFVGNLKSHLSEIIREHFKARFGKTKEEKIWLRYHAEGAAALVVTLLIAWMEDGLPFTEAMMAEKCRLAMAGIFSHG